MDLGARRSGAHEAAHRPAAKPSRGSAAAGGAPPAQPPPKVYRVEPRDFRELVQRLTGASSTAAPAGPATGARKRVTPAIAEESRRVEAAEQFDYASWFSAPLLSPAYGTAGFGGHHQGSGALL